MRGEKIIFCSAKIEDCEKIFPLFQYGDCVHFQPCYLNMSLEEKKGFLLFHFDVCVHFQPCYLNMSPEEKNLYKVFLFKK